jgi:hypothetical protein
MLKNLEKFITDDDVHGVLPVTNNFKIDNFLKHCQNAAENYMYKLVGQRFLQEIIDDKPRNEEVRYYTKSALIYFAASSFSDTGGLKITNEGIKEHQDETQKPVRLEVLSNFNRQCLKTAHSKMEFLMEYLELNAKKDFFETWKASSAYTILENSPVKSLAEFQKVIYINNSRIAFLALKTYLQNVWEMDLLEIRNQVENAPINSIQKMTADNYLKQIVCNIAYAKGINDIAVIIEDSIYQIDNRGVNRQSANYISAQQDIIAKLEQSKLQTANRLQDKLESLLLEWTSNDTTVPFENDKDSNVYFAG